VEAAEESAQELAERSVAAMLAADSATQALGIVVDGVGPGRARASMEIAAHMLNGHGTAHGGYIFMLADIAFAFACNTYGETTFGRSCDIEYLAPGREGDRLLAEASERYRRGRSGVYDVSVRRESDGVVLAEFRGHSRTVAS
jgi:phenylacetic acid degradation protein PaaD